ncbi:Molybdenum import ATP-binding ModC 1 [Gossypium arboreum]|uniref:Molybdenum import ATP-binding ModC 1 n=1 Tax=Gossypium arboreum TaxID=29729 RepID=A0A0B0N4P0_GOSAR|nr:Molybdenum import ATP-binding ModC 1 [Gossypium arboreum]
MCCGYLSACVSSPCSYVLTVSLLFRVSDSIPNVQRVNLIAKLAQGTEDVGVSITLSIGHLGIVSLNILSMACLGAWSFRYMSY